MLFKISIGAAAQNVFQIDLICINSILLGTQEEFYLGITALCIEGIPQFLILATIMTHWNGDFDTTALGQSNYNPCFLETLS